MSRIGLILLLTLGVSAGIGCSAQPPASEKQHSLTTTTNWHAGGREYVGEPIAASALVFAPPVTIGDPPLDLDRSARQASAFLGYDEGTVEQYRISVDDRQLFGNGNWGWGFRGRGFGGWYGSGWGDRYERRVESERIGSIRR